MRGESVVYAPLTGKGPRGLAKIPSYRVMTIIGAIGCPSCYSDRRHHLRLTSLITGSQGLVLIYNGRLRRAFRGLAKRSLLRGRMGPKRPRIAIQSGNLSSIGATPSGSGARWWAEGCWRRNATTRASSSVERTVERGTLAPSGASTGAARLRHLATVWGWIPRRLSECAPAEGAGLEGAAQGLRRRDAAGRVCPIASEEEEAKLRHHHTTRLYSIRCPCRFQCLA